MGQMLVSKALDNKAADGNNVRGQQGCYPKGSDGIECDCGANIDQRKKDRDNERNQDSVEGNIPTWLDLFTQFRRR